MKELDVLLERYLDAHLETASPEERADLEALLELQDPVLAGLLLQGQAADDPVLERAVARVLATAPPHRA